MSNPERIGKAQKMEGIKPDLSADLATRMAVSRHLRKVAAADPAEQSTADIDYRTVAELLTQ